MNLVEFSETIVKRLVKEPDLVKVQECESDEDITVEILVSEEDMGRVIGKNCKGEEKIKEFKKLFPNEKVECAYSDSHVDIPMLEYARRAFVVEDDELIPYKKDYKFKR